jgi:hypothetical protein
MAWIRFARDKPESNRSRSVRATKLERSEVKFSGSVGGAEALTSIRLKSIGSAAGETGAEVPLPTGNVWETLNGAVARKESAICPNPLASAPVQQAYPLGLESPWIVSSRPSLSHPSPGAGSGTYGSEFPGSPKPDMYGGTRPPAAFPWHVPAAPSFTISIAPAPPDGGGTVNWKDICVKSIEAPVAVLAPASEYRAKGAVELCSAHFARVTVIREPPGIALGDIFPVRIGVAAPAMPRPKAIGLPRALGLRQRQAVRARTNAFTNIQSPSASLFLGHATAVQPGFQPGTARRSFKFWKWPSPLQFSEWGLL